MNITEDRWLSSIFDFKIFKVEIEPSHESDGIAAASSLSNLVRRHANEQSSAMYYTKIETMQVDMVRELSVAGFYVVDVNVSFGIEGHQSPDPVEQMGVEIREVQQVYEQDVLNIAGSCFKYSRFHLDPKVSLTIAHQIKHDWIHNYILKRRGEKLWAALIDDRPVGFLAVLAANAEGRRIRVIDLIGVHKDFQGRGVGKALGAFFINHYHSQCDSLQVGTQIANIPSMRLYEKLGFSILKTQYVMHMHVAR